jgi:hypothetical protein
MRNHMRTLGAQTEAHTWGATTCAHWGRRLRRTPGAQPHAHAGAQTEAHPHAHTGGAHWGATTCAHWGAHWGATTCAHLNKQHYYFSIFFLLESNKLTNTNNINTFTFIFITWIKHIMEMETLILLRTSPQKIF